MAKPSQEVPACCAGFQRIPDGGDERVLSIPLLILYSSIHTSPPIVDMPANIANVTKLTESLGLQPGELRGDNAATLPAIHELYNTEIKKLQKLHYKKGLREIADDLEIRVACKELIERYGPVIWTEEKQRPWLRSHPDESSTRCSVLYWSSSTDQAQ